MNKLQTTYINALLTDAVYVKTLHDKLSQKDLESHLTTRMTPSQAMLIASNFEIIATKETDDSKESGFDAVIWRGRESGIAAGEIFVSLRGSEGVSDFIGDLDLALSVAARRQIVDMVNWWNQVVTPTDKMAAQIEGVFESSVSSLTPSTVPNKTVWVVKTADSIPGLGILLPEETGSKLSVTVNGHSLGGHLSGAFARLFQDSVQIDGVSTFNGAGFIESSEAFFTELEKALGLGKTRFYSAQNNYFAEHGINVTTNDWWFKQVGHRQAVFNEEGFGIPNHYMYKMTDTLALGYVLSMMNPELTLERLNALLNRASNQMENSLETLLDRVRKLVFGSNVVETQIGDVGDNAASRENYHEHLNELKEHLEKSGGNYRFSEISFEKAVETGDEGMAARYALKELNPFVLTGADYSKFNADGSLNLFSQDNPNGMTDAYIRERINMLEAKMAFDQQDREYLRRLFDSSVTDVSHYSDREAKLGFSVAPGPFASAEAKQALFGSEADDTLNGGTKADYLFGGAGDDVLDGKGGLDYLEGGSGHDTYRIEGMDTVSDSDLNGEIVFSDGLKAARFVRNSAEDKSWFSVDENGKFNQQMTAVRPEGSNVLMVKHGSDTAVIQGFFRDNNTAGLGIELLTKEKPDTAAADGLVLTGGYGRADKYNIFYANGNDRHFNLTGGNKDDVVFAGAAGALTVASGAGNDRIYGSYGADAIDGGGRRRYCLQRTQRQPSA